MSDGSYYPPIISISNEISNLQVINYVPDLQSSVILLI